MDINSEFIQSWNEISGGCNRIRDTGFSGKHLAKGERSMLGAFKDSTENHCESNVGLLIPLHAFYETIKGFLDPIIARTLSQAPQNDSLMKRTVNFLKSCL